MILKTELINKSRLIALPAEPIMHNAKGIMVKLDSVISGISCAGSVGGINVSTG